MAEVTLKEKTCVACGDGISGLKAEDDERVLSCGHVYYWLCFAQHVKSALSSLPFRPVKCCGQDPVPPSSIWLVQRGAQEAGFALSDAEVNKYIVLNDEARSNSPRVYCYKQECNAYIPAEDRTETVGWCWTCEVETCLTCRKAAHAGACDGEQLKKSQEADEKLFQLAEEQGWKKCPTCHAMIERIDGCNFLTCPCGQNFCYKCGIPELHEGDHFHDSDLEDNANNDGDNGGDNGEGFDRD
ncbi:hypothetical protein PG991_010979 [Apiospora marii]|uniref:RBR-type E3 ubiquitin transferase n=1 Tax=Apiospora marii TaxID=335849 RepID=A0ABR1RCX6_9PEZI